MKRKVIVELADGTEIETLVVSHSIALALWTAIGNVVTRHTVVTSPPVAVRIADR